MAVLPTPGSPMSTGLFLVRRDSTCMTRSISRCAADDRVELLLPGLLGEVAAELVEHGRALRASPALLALRTAGAAGWGAALPCLRAVAGQELDDLLADPGQVGAEAQRAPGGHALALTDEAEEHVLGADVVVAELQRLAERQLEDLLGPRGEGRRARGGRAGGADGLLHLLPDGLEGDAERLEGLGGDALALVDQPEQDVLGPDEVVVEEAGLLLGQHEDPAGPVGEAFEQVDRLLVGGLGGRVGLLSSLPGMGQHAGQDRWSPRPSPVSATQPAGRVALAGMDVAALLGASRPRRATWSGSKPRCGRPSTSRTPFLTEVAGHLVDAGGQALPARPHPRAAARRRCGSHRRRGPGRRRRRARAPRQRSTTTTSWTTPTPGAASPSANATVGQPRRHPRRRLPPRQGLRDRRRRSATRWPPSSPARSAACARARSASCRPPSTSTAPRPPTSTRSAARRRR